jgi:hypothetical protein
MYAPAKHVGHLVVGCSYAPVAMSATAAAGSSRLSPVVLLQSLVRKLLLFLSCEASSHAF